MADPWDQLDNEPDIVYKRFLIYRNLGVRRTLPRANEVWAQMEMDAGVAPAEATCTWGNYSSRYHWWDRAQAWDIAMLKEQGRRLAAKHMAYLEALLERMHAALVANPDAAPKTWTELLGGAHEMAEHIPAATIAAAINGPAQRDPGTGGDDAAGLLAEIRHINAQVESCTVKMLPERARGLPHAGPGGETLGQADRDRPGAGADPLQGPGPVVP